MLGGTDELEEGTWRWVSDGAIFSKGSAMVEGAVAPELKWNYGEPNNARQENWVQLSTDFKLNDISRLSKQYYICEEKGTAI